MDRAYEGRLKLVRQLSAVGDGNSRWAHFVDDACDRVRSGELDRAEARELAARVRFQVSLLVPDRMAAYDLIYGSRFERLIELRSSIEDPPARKCAVSRYFHGLAIALTDKLHRVVAVVGYQGTRRLLEEAQG